MPILCSHLNLPGALGTADHSILLDTLSSHGFPDFIISWVFFFFFLLLVISSQFPWLVPRFLPNLLPRPTLSPWSFSFIHLLTLLKESHSL